MDVYKLQSHTIWPIVTRNGIHFLLKLLPIVSETVQYSSIIIDIVLHLQARVVLRHVIQQSRNLICLSKFSLALRNFTISVNEILFTFLTCMSFNFQASESISYS